MQWGDPTGCVRVSTKPQDTDRQEQDFLAAGLQQDDLYIDHGVSGAFAMRPTFGKALVASISLARPG